MVGGGAGQGTAGGATEKMTLEFEVKDQQLSKVDRIRDATKGLTKEENNLTQATKSSSKATEENTQATTANDGAKQASAKTTEIAGAELHRYNMSILGINMSLLGLSFNLRNLNILSNEQAASISGAIAPFQMMLTLMNMGMAMNFLYAQSTDQVRLAMTQLTSSMLFIGALMAMMTAKGTKMRVVLAMLTVAIGLWAAKNWMAAKAEAAKLSMLGPMGWGTMIAGLALLGLTMAALSSKQAASKAYAGKIIDSPTMIRAGEHREAIIPLGSPKAYTLGLSGPGSGGIVIQKAYFTVLADTPRTLYREMSYSVNRQRYVRA